MAITSGSIGEQQETRYSRLRLLTYATGTVAVVAAIAAAHGWAADNPSPATEGVSDPSLNAESLTFLSNNALDVLRNAKDNFYHAMCATTIPWVLDQVDHVIRSLTRTDTDPSPLWSVSERLVSISKDEQTQKMVRAFWSVSTYKQTQEMAEAAVKASPHAFMHVREDLQTQEMAEATVKADPFNFPHVREDLQTQEMAEAAVKARPSNFDRVRKDLQTKEMAETFIKTKPLPPCFPDYQCLRVIRTDLQTREIVDAAVEVDFFNFPYVREDLQTQEMVDAVMKVYPSALDYVREDLQTQEMVDAVLKADPSQFWYVREDLQTQEMVDAVLKTSPFLIEFVPKQFINTHDMAMFAINWGFKSLESIPEQFRTLKLCEQAIKITPSDYQFVPELIRAQLNKIGVDSPSTEHNISLPITEPLPHVLQKFMDKHFASFQPNFLQALLGLSPSPIKYLTSQGFTILGEGSVKTTWTHPELPGYVIKVPNLGHFSIEISNSAMIDEISTLRHLQKIVTDAALHRIMIPSSYLIQTGGHNIILQERINLIETNALGKDFYSDELATLFQHADSSLYPEIDPVTKLMPKKYVVSLVEKLHKRENRQYTQWEKQFLQRAWIWDLAPEYAHNCGLVEGTKDLPDDQKRFAIIDGAL